MTVVLTGRSLTLDEVVCNVGVAKARAQAHIGI